MSFSKKEVDNFLAEVGRMCCICKRLHKIQLHHIVPLAEGGTDEIDNAIALCPNCHDEVHSSYASGRTTRVYTPEELKEHIKSTKNLAMKVRKWQPGSDEWEHDAGLIRFYAQCFDRPAFTTPFLHEFSYVNFDRAMEDTILALNTGFWRTREGDVIARSEGKTQVINTQWRQQLENLVMRLEGIRAVFNGALGLDRIYYTTPADKEFMMERRFRNDHLLADKLNELRNEVIGIMNSLLAEIGLQSLRTIP